jgi:hypothetical protein
MNGEGAGTMRVVPLTAGGDRTRQAVIPDARWLSTFAVVAPGGAPLQQAPSPQEGLVVILSGAHDLFAGGGSWARRGLRPTPFEGRPCALYVPPGIEFAAVSNEGELLVVRARLPAKPGPKEVSGRKPLLPLAGSGKAFDGERGDWVRIEDFAHSPEAILPRRIQAEESGSVRVEHVFPPDYKAAVLSLDEAVLRAGATWAPAIPRHAVEVALYARPIPGGELRCRAGGVEVSVTGEAVVHVPAAFEEGALALSASGGCYVAAAFAGPKGQT